jgi:methylaspartate ammonia-lyase
MKKYIFTENQIKKIIDSQLNEQMSGDAGFNAVYGNPTIKDQLAKKKFPSGTKYGFSQATVDALSNPKSPRLSHSNVLYQVKPGDTVDGIVNKMGANSKDNIMGDNDLLRGNPKAIQPGMIITFSLLPSR